MDNKAMKEMSGRAVKGSQLIELLSELYSDACLRKDYKLCEKLRLEIRRCVSNEKLLIPLEPAEGLLIDPMKFLLGA